MDKSNLKSEKDYITLYQNKEYDGNFRVVDDMLVDLDDNSSYTPKDIFIVAEHRFEGMSNPGDMSILYIIETNTQQKGTVLVNYNPSNATALAEFFNSIPKDNISQKANPLI